MKKNKKKLLIYGSVAIIIILIIFSGYYLLKTKQIREGTVMSCGEGTAIYLDESLCWQKGVKSTETANWQEASDYCDSLILGEKEDWRLPTLVELSSIVDKSIEEIAINQTVFEDTEPKQYWTSEKYSLKDGAHWYVHFDIGYQGFALDFNKNYGVRCIRDNILI